MEGCGGTAVFYRAVAGFFVLHWYLVEDCHGICLLYTRVLCSHVHPLCFSCLAAHGATPQSASSLELRSRGTVKFLLFFGMSFLVMASSAPPTSPPACSIGPSSVDPPSSSYHQR